MLAELVVPIVTLAKKNLIHNANKNQKVEDLREALQHQNDRIVQIQKEVEKLNELNPIV